jgi:hypothetical protein
MDEDGSGYDLLLLAISPVQLQLSGRHRRLSIRDHYGGYAASLRLQTDGTAFSHPAHHGFSNDRLGHGLGNRLRRERE